MKKILLSLGICSSLITLAQNQNCGNNRFFSNIFNQTNATIDIQYGQNTTVGGASVNLLADVYEPVGDVATHRPLIILMHGGSFISGDKSDMTQICEYYAQKGFVAASISYRLFDGPLFPLPDSNSIAEVVVQSTSDLKAAIRWFKDDAANGNQFEIDTNYVLVGGISAGSISALHAMFLDPSDNVPPFLMQFVNDQGGWEGNSNNITGVSSKAHGVFNFSGALYRANFLQTGDVPVYSVHDEFDGVVPYGNDFVSLSGIPLLYVEGSESIYARAQNIGVESMLNTIDGSAGHVSYFNPADMTQGEQILDQSATFMTSKVVCPGAVNVTELNKALAIDVYPNPSKDLVTIQTDLSSAQLLVTNTTGQVVTQISSLTDKTVLDVSRWNTGLYMLSVFSSKGELLQVEKLIVR